MCARKDKHRRKVENTHTRVNPVLEEEEDVTEGKANSESRNALVRTLANNNQKS